VGCKTAPEIPIKSPYEERLRVFDFGGDDLEEGETVQDVDALTVTPTGDAEDLTATDPVPDGTTVVLTVAAGRAGVEYTVNCRITTSLGQKLEAIGLVRVEAA
jgi:hypothetical protein